MSTRMETFPEVASLALQALSGLLAQRPCPLSADRLCQILMVNMFNVDRAAIFTAQSTASMAAAAAATASSESAASTTTTTSKGRSSGRKQRGPSGAAAQAQQQQKQESETLRSVHHDHAARFALDTFSLVCRRAAKLFTEVSLQKGDDDDEYNNSEASNLHPFLFLFSLAQNLHRPRLSCTLTCEPSSLHSAYGPSG